MSSHTFSITGQEFADKSVNVKVVQLQTRSFLRLTGEDLRRFFGLVDTPYTRCEFYTTKDMTS